MGGQTEEGRDGVREGTRVKVCKTGHIKGGGRGQVSGREREGEEEGQFETEVVFEFRGQGCRVGVFSTLTEEQHYYSLWWQPALTQLVK